MKTCPTCGGKLNYVPKSGNMNSDQWDAVKAGDWFCKACPDNGRGKTGYCYWFDSEIEAHERRQCEAISRT